MSIEVEWLGGNCPVQAEGTFDGEPFYFRARGTSVTCDVGDWMWEGPEYEWPLAGWISEAVARAYIETAYDRWRYWDKDDRAKCRRRNGLTQEMMSALRWAGWLQTEIGDAAKPAHDRLMAYADEIRQRRDRQARDE